MPLISLSCCFSVRWDVLLLRSRSFYDDHLVSSQAGITPGSQNKHKVKSPPPVFVLTEHLLMVPARLRHDSLTLASRKTHVYDHLLILAADLPSAH